MSIADRYLGLLSQKMDQEQLPCFIQLAIVSTLIAAKLEQPISPSFSRMVGLVLEEW